MIEAFVKSNVENQSQYIESPEEAEVFCDGLIDTMAELISLLERETQLVRKAKRADVSTFHVRKQALSTTLVRNISLLKLNADYIKMAVPEHIEKIKAQQGQFQKSLLANHDVLSAMKAVSEQLIQTIAKKAGEIDAGPTTYGKNSGMNAPGKAPSAAISIDRIL